MNNIRNIRVIYKGKFRDLNTRFGRFKRGKIRILSEAAAMYLLKNYPGFEVEGNFPSAINLAAKAGKKIGIFRNGGLGDVLAVVFFLSLPLKKAHPDTRVYFYCDKPYVELLSKVPFLDDVKPMPADLSRFDVSINLCWVPETKDPNSKQVRPEIFAEAAGDLADYKFDFLSLPPKEVSAARNRLRQKGWTKDRPLVGFQLTSVSPIRVYPPHYSIKLIELLIKEGFQVALFGTDQWGWKICQWEGDFLYSFIDQTTLLEVGALIQCCDYFIAPDSGLLHLASVVGVPTLGIFGNIKPENRIKYYPKTKAIYPEGELACIPCGDRHNPCPECTGLGESGRFGGKCIHLLQPHRVFSAFMGLTPFPERKARLKLLCPFCGGGGDLVNVITGSWFSEFYSEKIPYYKCSNCNSVFSDRNLKTVSYEGEYWTAGAGKFAGDYFQKQEYHESIHNKVESIVKEYFRRA